MDTLLLSEDDVESLLDMPAAIDALDEAFRALAVGAIDNVPRRRARSKSCILHSMSATAENLNLAGWKQYTTTRDGAKFHVGLYDLESGALVALIQADRLGQLRTGAATGVAARYLSPPDLEEMALIGTGWQAESQLAAVASVRPLNRAFVYSRSAEKRRTFSERLSKQLNLEVIPVETAAEAVRGRPLVVTATTSRQPVVAEEQLERDCFLAAIGSNWLQKAEVAPETVARAARVVCDSLSSCQAEAGELAQAEGAGVWDWSQAEELAEVVTANQEPGGGLILFKSVGMAMEDLAVGKVVLERARERKMGTVLPI